MAGRLTPRTSEDEQPKAKNNKTKGKQIPFVDISKIISKSEELEVVGEFVKTAAVGTHIAHFDAPWILGVGPFDPEDYGFTKDNIP